MKKNETQTLVHFTAINDSNSWRTDTTGNCDVFMMFTVVYTPRGVCTLADIYLSTVTLNVVQPDLSSTDTVVVVRLRSNVPDSVAGTL